MRGETSNWNLDISDSRWDSQLEVRHLQLEVRNLQMDVILWRWETGETPPIRGERPLVGSEEPLNGGESLPTRGERFSIRGERVPLGGEIPPIRVERPPVGGGLLELMSLRPGGIFCVLSGVSIILDYIKNKEYSMIFKQTNLCFHIYFWKCWWGYWYWSKEKIKKPWSTNELVIFYPNVNFSQDLF